MAREIKTYDNCTFNELVERPVDIFYGDKTEIISISFTNLPNSKCTSNKVWKEFLQDTWDKHLPGMHNILDFMRYITYHTGLVGRFYKVNCILSLDDIFALLKDRLPNPEDCFRTWYNLHTVARLVLEETYKTSALNISFNLDLHTRTNTACDNSEVKIKFLNAENLPNEHELVLIYHLTVCYTRNESNSTQSHLESFSNISDNSKEFSDHPEVAEESKSASCQIQSGSNDVVDWQKYGARPKTKSYSLQNYTEVTSNEKEYEINNFDSFSNISDNNEKLEEFKDQPEVAKESKSTSCQMQSGSNDVDWQKYGARPKIKSYSLTNFTNVTTNEKEYEINNLDKKYDEQHISRSTERPRTRRMSQNRSRHFGKAECIEKELAENLRAGDGLEKSAENCKSLPTFDGLSLPPYSGPTNSKELYSSLNNNGNFNTSSDCTPSVSVSPPLAAAAGPIASDLLYAGPADSKLYSSLNSKEHLNASFAYTPSVLVSPPSPPLAAAAAASGPSTSDLLFPAPYIPITSEDNPLWKNDGAIGKSYGNCSCENQEKRNVSVMELLQRAAKNIKEQYSRELPDVNSLELAENEKRLDTAEAKIRALQAPYEALLLSFIRQNEGLPVSTPDNDPILASQHDSSLQLPYTSFQSESVHKDITGGGHENSNLDMNIDENFLRIRENILRHEVRTFFENNNFLVASCEGSMSSAKTGTNFPVNEHGNISPLPDFQFDRLSLVDAKRSPESINASASGDQITVSSRDDPNHGYLAIKNYDDKISFRWESSSDPKASSSKQPSDSILLQDTSAEKSLKNLENEKLTLRVKDKEVSDKEPDEIDAMYAKFFEELSQNLYQNTSSQKMSPRYSENLQRSSTHKNHPTSEKKSEHVEVLQSACSGKTDDQAKLISEEEMLSNPSDESLNLSDIDYELGYELDYELDSGSDSESSSEVK